MYRRSVPPGTSAAAVTRTAPVVVAKNACMSFTAPQFSLDDEQAERDNLPVEVKDALRQDLCGITAIRRETSAWLQECRRTMHEFLRHEIPAERQVAYQQALHRAPELVADESDPVVFLRAEDYDPEAAAWRMVNYWRIRKAIFGDRALSPLRELQDDQERLDQEDGVDDVYVEGGYPVGTYISLPEDCFGRAVLFFADGRQHDAQRALRRTFLLFHELVYRQECNQRQGCVIVIDARSIDPNHFNRKQYRRKLEFLREAVPMRIRAVHICFAAFKSPARLLQPSILWMYGPNLRLRRKVHYGSRKFLAQSLLEYGLKLEALPPSLGGTLEVGVNNGPTKELIPVQEADV